MENLPLDISLNILSRVPASSLIRCSLVCKLWRSLVQNPRLHHLHLTYHQSHVSNPSLILHKYLPTSVSLYFVDSFFFDNNENKLVAKKVDIPFKDHFDHMTCPLSCNGLLCFHRWPEDPDSPAYCIFNPFNAQFEFLPKCSKPIKSGPYRVVSGFGFIPGSEEYKVVRIASNHYGAQSIEVITLGTSLWRRIEQTRFLITSATTCRAFVNGRLHWFAQDKEDGGSDVIVSLHLLSEEFCEVPSPDVMMYVGSIRRIIELGGCLSMVTHPGDMFCVWVMKEYGVKDSWERKFTIKCLDFSRTYQLPQPLCLLKNGDILVEVSHELWNCYDPQNNNVSREIRIKHPQWVSAVPHQASLISAIR